jgi:hypothetical protein
MKKPWLPVALFALISIVSVAGQDFPRLEPDPFFVEAGRQEDPWSVDMILEVSLRASGTAPDKIPRYITVFQTLKTEAEIRTASGTGDYEKGELLLAWLHETLLRKYDIHQTRIDILLDTGGYNCVSSGLVYMIFARMLGLDVHSIYAVDHAFCFLRAGNSSWDVETTNPFGFDPGSKKEFTDSFTGNTGYSYVPPRDYTRRVNISDREMIGFIFQNRIASLQKENHHRDTLPLALDRWAMTGSDMGRRDFISTVRNTAAGYNNSGQYQQGMMLLLEVDRLFQVLNEPAVKEVFEALAYNGLVSLLNEGRLEEAVIYYGEVAARGVVAEKKLVEYRMLLERKRIDLLVKTGTVTEIVPAVENGFREGLLDGKYRNQILLFVFSREADSLVARSGYSEARRFLETFPEDLKGGPDFRKMRETYRHNHAVTVHNEFARLYNAGEFEKARQYLAAAMPDLPDDPLLVKDRDMLKKKGFWD